jgi:hypothetical protein
LLAGEIIGREFDGRLGVGIALDGAVHPRMQFREFPRQTAMHGRRQMSRNDLDSGSKTLAEIAAELAAPVLKRGRLAPTGGAGHVRHLHQDVAADGLGQPRPFVLTPRRQRNVMKLDRSDGCFGHARSVHTLAGSRAGVLTGGR